MIRFYRNVRVFICLCLVAAFLGCAATQERDSTGQYFDDSVITAKVKAAILGEATLKVFQINVTTYHGIVQLSGFVDKQENVDKATEVISKIAGIKEVKNSLLVKQ
ncbi:MAG TPA: BON domain-containing protein [Nitrospirota bacterium]|nr:BON domain-containing protein [Nitrospirota bacterium]